MDLSKSLEPLVEKIEKLSKTVRIVICVASLILIAVPFVFLSYKPQYEEINKLKGELKKVQAERDKARKRAGELKKIQKQVKEAEEDFNIAKKALPESEEIPSLLTNISHAGQDAGLEFLLFKPDRMKKTDDNIFYEEIPISIEVLGGYHNTLLFFYKVARLNRIVTIKDIKMIPASDKKKEGDLKVSCKAVTYKFVEAPPPKTDKKKK
jgi:type IV pilus assembly protein PilO